MANQIQATVYQIDGNPLPSPIVISFLTNDILMRRNAISTIPEVSSSITYYPNTSNQLQEQTFFVSEDLRVLRDAANTNGTTQVPTIILEIDGDPLLSGGIEFLFPVNAVSIWPSINMATGVNSFIEFKNKRYYAAQTEAELNAQANVNNVLPYKVYTALLTQNGESNFIKIGSGATTQGVTYMITDDSNGDFINVGAPNNDIGTSFVGNGNTPNNYGDAKLRYDEGAPVVTVLENTIGNVQWYRDGSGYYYVYSDDALFTSGKTFVTISHSNYNYDGTTPYYLDGTSYIYVMTLDNTWTYIDDILHDTSIEIRVYN